MSNRRGLLSPELCKMQSYCVLKQVVHIITAGIESVLDILDASLRGLVSPQGCKMQSYCVLKQVVHIITTGIHSVVKYSVFKSSWPTINFNYNQQDATIF